MRVASRRAPDIYIPAPTASFQLSWLKVNTTSRASFAFPDDNAASRSRRQLLLASAMVCLRSNLFSGNRSSNPRRLRAAAGVSRHLAQSVSDPVGALNTPRLGRRTNIGE